MTETWVDDFAVALSSRLGAARGWGSPLELALDLHPGYRLRPHLEYLADRLVAALVDVELGHSRYLLVSMPPRAGKALALDTPLPTPTGWTTMGAVAVGDELLDETGQPCRVTAVSPVWQDRPCFEVSSRSGRLVADAEHEWLSMLPDSRPNSTGQRRREWRLRTTEQLARPRNKRACLPPTPVLDLPEADLPIDPYVLGAWLGDGGSWDGSFTTDDPEHFRQEFTAAGYVLSSRAARFQYGVLGLQVQLRAAGLLRNKHIPAVYLRASARQRLALLQGIVDTDGHVNKNGIVEVSLSKEGLLRQVAELARSLGAVTSVQRAEKKQWGGFTMWRVQFRLADAARLARKRARLRDGSRQEDLHRVEFRPTRAQATRCLEVDSTSHLFLAGEAMIPTHNSLTTSVYLPLWILQRHPDWRIMLLSHSPDLAAGWGRQVRRLIERHPALRLEVARDAGAATDWETTAGGQLLSRSIRQSITGRGANCVTGETVVESEYGQLSATAAYEREVTQLLAYDHVTQRAVWRPVEAARRSRRADILEIRTTNGRLLRCTSDHPIYTSRGYVPAGNLRTGDALVVQVAADGVLVRSTVPAGAVHRAQEDQARLPERALQSRVSQQGATQELLCRMRRLVGAPIKHQAVWSSVSSGVLGAATRTDSHPQDLRGMRRVLRGLGRILECTTPVLRQGLQELGARPVNVHRGEAPVQHLVSQTQTADPRAGRVPLRGMPERGSDSRAADSTGSAPHRSQQGQRHAGELDLTVSSVSRSAPRVECDTVSSVEWAGSGAEWVYDFQVEGTHNFFAGEILTHNCLLIDDPVKDFADAHSRVSRDFVWDWWTANSRTRLEPPALVVVTQTRWHEDDFAGRLLNPEFEGAPDQWEVIRLPALAEEHDVLGRAPGEPLLSPLLDETPLEALARWQDIRQAVGTYAFSALYQARPGPSEGMIFQDDWWKWWRPGDLDEHPPTRIITSWDCTFKDTDSSDFVVGQKWGQRGADRILLDQVRGRWSFTETLAQMEAFCAGTPEHLVESAANGPAVIDVLKNKIPGMIPVIPQGSKESRARAVTPEIESGNVFLPATAAWLPEYLAELRAFPSGTHDDQCLVGETKITTPGGLIRLDEVQAGEYVLGASGWVQVLAAGQTGTAKVVTRAGLTGTPAHPVWTGTLWTPLSEIVYNDVLWIHAKSKTASNRARHEVGASGTTCAGTSTEILRRVESASARLFQSVRRVGSRSRVFPSRVSVGRAGSDAPEFESKKSTIGESSSAATLTLDKTPTATTLSLVEVISLVALNRSTGKSTRTTTGRFPRVGMSIIWTARRLTTTRVTLWRFRPENTPLSQSKVGGSAVKSGTIVRQCWSTLSGFARLRRRGIDLRRVGSGTASTLDDHSTVFNLTTSDGTYFANGVLVHNCDSTTQALLRLRDQGNVITLLPSATVRRGFLSPRGVSTRGHSR